MNQCGRHTTCPNMTCYHINVHTEQHNCKEHECFFDGAFNKSSCIPKEQKRNKPDWVPENPYCYTALDIPHINDVRIAIEQGFDEGSLATAKAMLTHLIAKKGYCNQLAVVDFKDIESMLKELEGSCK